MLLKKTITALLLLCVLSANAQEEFVQSPSRYITEVPFKLLTGGIIIIRAAIADLPDSLNFILDTGSGGISLDSITALRLKLNTEPSQRTIRGIAGIRKVRFWYDQTLKLPGLAIDSLDFHINDYDLLSSVYGEKIDGIIGYSFLSRYIVHINYDSLKMFIYSKGRLRYPRGGYLMKPILVNIPVTGVSIRDALPVTSRFYFDTGAGMCLLLSSDFVEDSMFVRNKSGWKLSQAEGLGGKTPMKQGVVKQVKLGPYKFRSVPTYIFDDNYNITSYPFLGGLIGNDLLRRFNLILNYEKREINLLPNSHFREKFDYSYTGLGMYVVDGLIRVVDVMKHSPAEKSGFLPEDVIVSVDNNFSGNIQDYKNLMQVPGKKVKVIVYRKGEPVMLVLKVGSLLN
jgi:Aspartyl protease/PDZ domain